VRDLLATCPAFAQLFRDQLGPAESLPLLARAEAAG
jgi:hypothetical protein